MPPKIAAVTMAYNEAALLPLWARHYARQVGADYCFVVDHGSTEPLDLPRGVNLLRLPRSPHDDPRRAAFISDLAGSLLHYFDWVLYTDVDELLLADPAQFANLPAFCAQAASDVVFAVGLDVQHVTGSEPALDPALAIGTQRGWARFTSAMCKPVLTRQPLTWAPGFHACDHRPAFAPLYLFHLHWADRALGLRRQAKTRDMAWASHAFGAHARVSDRDWADLFDGMARLPQQHDAVLDWDRAPVSNWLSRLAESTSRGDDGIWTMPLDLNAGELWPIPAKLRDQLR